MTTRSHFDYLLQRQADGYSQDYWLSDSDRGRKEIARLEAEAHTARTVDVDARVRQAVATASKQQQARDREALEAVVTALGKKFAEQRDQLRQQMEADFASLRLEVENELLTVRKRGAALDAEVEEAKSLLRQAQEKPRVIRGGVA